MKNTIALSLLALASFNLSAAALDPDTTFNGGGSRLQVYYDLGGGNGENVRDTAVAATTGAI